MNAEAKNALDAYLDFNEELKSIEHECETEEFVSCPICEREKEINFRMRRIVELWAMHWAVELSRLLGKEEAVMNALHQELVNLWQFFQAIFICLCMTGLIAVPFILIAYEQWKRRV